MRLNVAFQSALALGLLSSADAFVLPTAMVRPRASPVVQMSQQQGWDNDDFLNALSGGSDALDEANEKYKQQSKFDPDMIPPRPSQQEEKSPPSQQQEQSPPSRRISDEEPLGDTQEDQGGSRFKELLKAAQDPSRANLGPHTAPPQYTPPPQYTDQQQPPPPAQPAMPAADLENLSVEEQARMFREFMAQQQQQPPQQYAQPPPPPPARQMPGGVDAQGRKIGRNKDADSIANSSDVYLTQLKRDSAVRTMARYSGDEQTANAVFEDDSVKEAADLLRKNPYLSDQQEKARSFVEGTSSDELLVVVPEKTKTDKPKSFTGVSFRKKFEEVKQKKKKGPAVQEEPVAQEAVVEEPPAAVEPPKAVASPPVEETPVVEEQDAPAAQEAPSGAGETKEDTRRQLRTLQGLMLKHRGGPGFGAGRLKGQEAARFENLLKDVTDTLRSEAGMPPAPEKEPVVAAAKPAVEAPAVAIPEPAVAGETTGDPLVGTMACVEGAVSMYKQSDPAEKEGVLLSVRSALMDAVNKCNKVIAENEVANKQAYESEVTAAADPPVAEPPTMAFPDYSVAESEQEVAPMEPDAVEPAEVAASAPAPVATDPNTKLFASIYSKLEEASGSGQFGLKDGLTPEDANSLADQLVEMRDVLMEELDSGIPDSPASTASQEATPEPPAASSSSSSSNYKNKLAKAKAEKKAKDDV